MSKTDAQKRWLSSFRDSFNKHDADAIAKLYASDAVYAELSSDGGESKGAAAIKTDYATELEGFSDAKLAITRSWHVGDVVAFEYIEAGTGTGNDDKEHRFGFVGAHLLWFDPTGEHVVRDQIYFDDVTLRVQLGWADPPLSKLPVRPVVELPKTDGAWEVNDATGTPEEAKNVAVRDKLYTKLMTRAAEGDFLSAVTDDVVMSEYDDPANAVGKKAVGGVFKDWHKTFSDMRIESTHAWPCRPYVLFEGIFAGKQTGPWGPLKPTNKPFAAPRAVFMLAAAAPHSAASRGRPPRAK